MLKHVYFTNRIKSILILVISVIVMVVIMVIILDHTNRSFHKKLVENTANIFDQKIMGPIVLFWVQVGGLVFLVKYVVDTAKIAKYNQESAIISRQTVEAIRINREEEIAPYVIMYVTITSSSINLIMENTGRTVAKNIKLIWEPVPDASLTINGVWDSFILNTTPNLMPGQKRVAFLSTFHVLSNPKLENQYIVHVEYNEGKNEKTRKDTYTIDFKSYEGIIIEEDVFKKKMLELLNSIKKELSSLAGSVTNVRNEISEGILISSSNQVLTDAYSPEQYIKLFGMITSQLQIDWSTWVNEYGSIPTFPISVIKKRIQLQVSRIESITDRIILHSDTYREVKSLTLTLQKYTLFRGDFSSLLLAEEDVTKIINALKKIGDDISKIPQEDSNEDESW